MFGDGALSFREFIIHEPIPLATIHDSVLGFLCGRTDCILFGAQAVNAYTNEPRMTQDVDILSLTTELAEELREYLASRFQIAVRVRVVSNGYRLYQVRKQGNRHLVDIRTVSVLPAYKIIDGVLVIDPVDLIIQKVRCMVNRSNSVKGPTDLTDIRRLLLTFPELKVLDGCVTDGLRSANASAADFNAWQEIVDLEIIESDNEYY